MRVNTAAMNDRIIDTSQLEPVVAAPRIGDMAPDFMARTTQGMLTLSALRGQWVLLFSHPADFTPVCTSEFIAFAQAAAQFAAMNCALVGLSVDSLPAHLAWIEAIRERFDVRIPFPVVEDPSMAIARAYGMLDPTARNSATVRSVYMIDPQGIVRATTCYPMTVGRSVAELLRLLAALQRVDEGDVLTPEGWTPGGNVVLPTAQTQDAVMQAGPSWFMCLKPDQGR
ncbi:peroxiredoxin [Acetobacter pasteurianus]|uniref:Thioredoxin peroxidase n=4 Tax=Acetobacter pasteurianus TaxID=438 RepID=A0A401WWA4_ACEPA|nr:peroxiredoxin [Acetobacter pasteurianus]BAU39471.1 peroxiredoxin [Acetobacter pasteurianus NBRC 101655]ASC05975.1 Peroxiredoxin [Acetobacter pasteurianus subsp. pasteurianus]CCT59290.1 peroxiredoxin [Acetobacter pasteurianus 386B]BAI00471.1 peroxiredoxin [Acetobacter pasteurianus IFO 3283-01]BAI03522.1 peroxiredoxin [Acetobacter pasteurianus IFO 3283-03]